MVGKCGNSAISRRRSPHLARNQPLASPKPRRQRPLIPMVRKIAERGCVGPPISRSNVHPLRDTHLPPLPDFGHWTSDFGLAAVSHRHLIPMVRKIAELGSHRGNEVDCLAPPLAPLWTLDFGLWTARPTHHAIRNTQYSSRLDCQRATGRHSSWPTLNFEPETSNWLWLGPAS